MKTAVYGVNGQKVSDTVLKPEVFEQKVNEGLIHQVVRAELINARRGTASTKTRSEVKGGGKKPWRQKGTGRARAGSIRSPLFIGGGIVFGPKPKQYMLTIPRKMRKAALKSILSAKAKEKEIIVLDKLALKEPKTRVAKEMLEKLKIDKKSTIVIEKSDVNVMKSFRNLPATNVVSLDRISPYTILDNKVLVITKGALQEITEALA